MSGDADCKREVECKCLGMLIVKGVLRVAGTDQSWRQSRPHRQVVQSRSGHL